MTTAEQTFPNDAKCLMCDDDGALWREIYFGGICHLTFWNVQAKRMK